MKQQTELEGFEAPAIEAVDKAASEFLKCRIDLADAKVGVEEARAAVIATMKEHDAPVYRFVDGETSYTFALEEKERLSCKREKNTPADYEGDEAEE